MALLDEFDELNKKYLELIDEHNALKVSHTSLSFDLKKSKDLEKNLRIEIDTLKRTNLRIQNDFNICKKNRMTSTVDLKSKPRKRHYNSNHLRNPFPRVRCFSCGMLGHISHTCTIHRSTIRCGDPNCMSHSITHMYYILLFIRRDPNLFGFLNLIFDNFVGFFHKMPHERLWYLDNGGSWLLIA